MRIKDVIKNVDKNGRVINAYVVFVDQNGNERYQPIISEEQYQFFRRRFSEQIKRDEELRRQTPYTYRPRANYSTQKNTHRNVRISPKVLAAFLAGAIAVTGAYFTLNRKTPDFTVVSKIQTEARGKTTAADRYIERNAEEFEKVARALATGDYSDCPDVDTSFVRDFINTCYSANVDDVLAGGPLDGARYDFSFDNYMPASDMATFSIIADDNGYETIMKRYRNTVDLNEFNAVKMHYQELEKHLNKVLKLVLQRENNEDQFVKLSPYTRMVICAGAKSMLSIADPNYNFFNYNYPQRNQTRDELIEAVEKRENEAEYAMKMQVLNGHSSEFMRGKQR
jgi:hypothetical protein